MDLKSGTENLGFEASLFGFLCMAIACLQLELDTSESLIATTSES